MLVTFFKRNFYETSKSIICFHFVRWNGILHTTIAFVLLVKTTKSVKQVDFEKQEFHKKTKETGMDVRTYNQSYKKDPSTSPKTKNIKNLNKKKPSKIQKHDLQRNHQQNPHLRCRSRHRTERG